MRQSDVMTKMSMRNRVGQSDVTINMGTYCLFPVGKSHVATNIDTKCLFPVGQSEVTTNMDT